MSDGAASEPKKRVMLIAGEASADLHAAYLVRALHAKNPNVHFYGVGGSHLRAAGMEIWIDAKEIAVVGLTEVLRNLRVIRRAIERLKRALREDPPDALVLLDLPDFNLRIAPTAKELGIPVIYYISPQVWAWRAKRVWSIAKVVDTMLVVFPFEPQWYAPTGLDVRFVGHPLVDELELAEEPREYDAEYPTVALVPGSRLSELARMLPPMIGAARRIAAHKPGVRFVLPIAPTIEQELVETEIQFLSAGAELPIEFVEGGASAALRRADFALVTSGTSTLEAGIWRVPMLIAYRLSWLTYLLGRLLVKVKMIGLVNHVLGRKAVPEFIQHEAGPETLARHTIEMLESPRRMAELKSALEPVRERLGGKGASERAADAVLEAIG